MTAPHPAAARRSKAVRVATKAVPNIVVAAVVPAVLFIVGKHAWGLVGAIVAVVGWNFACQLVRRLAGRRWSALLVIGLVELTIRTVLSLSMHSARAFFVIPCVVTALTGAAFVGSALRARPLLSAVVAELVPASVLDWGDARIRRLLARGSVLYGLEQIAVAVISAAMAMRVSSTTYVTVHPPVSWLVLGLGVVVAVVVLRRDIASLRRRPQPPRATVAALAA